MKRIVLVFALAMLLLLIGAAASAEASTTVLVYMCGADLQDAACVDLYEMAESENGANTNIVVLAGGAEEWDDEDLVGGTRNLITISDGGFQSVDDVDQASMGSAESLLEFLIFGLEEYPAERTVFILWNHGGGTEGGICFDALEGEDGLTLSEIREALDALNDEVPGWHIDVFGCDACMMASYELTALLSNYSIDYFIASEEVEPGIGWYYTPWLKALDEEPGMSSEALCRQIVDSYMDDNRVYNPDEPYGLSAVDLNRLRPLAERMEDLAASMNAALENGQLASLRRSRSRLYTFGSFCDGSWDMVDMGAAVDAYAAIDPQAAADVKQLLGEAVIANRRSESMTECSGLALLIPEDTPEDYGTYRDGFDVSHCLPNWMAFLDNYTGRLNGADYSFGELTPVQVGAGDTVCGVDNSLWNHDWLEEEAGESYTISESEYGFTTQLTAQDLENLDYVEGMMLWDMSDDEMDCFVDLGLSRSNLIDWQSGVVTSLFDGSWPTFGDQLVPLYDQASSENSRRSLIPVKLNGNYTYLVVVFPSGSGEGRILGANAGYDENGLPIRETTRLQPGDVIVPVYTMYYGEVDSDEDYEEGEFEGDEIIWRDGMTVSYVSFEGEWEEDDEPMRLQFCFVLNDIFGDYTMSDFIEFEL